LEVDQIIEQWVTPLALCFKVRVAERVYRLEYHRAEDAWEAKVVRPE
jgi:hypothetical protein